MPAPSLPAMTLLDAPSPLSSTASAPAFAWQPALNAYGFPDRLLLCLDLAGIDQQTLHLTATEHALVIRGSRAPITPPDGPPEQVLAIEIDQGEFTRAFHFPRPVDLEGAEVNGHAGLWWIRLPYRTP